MAAVQTGDAAKAKPFVVVLTGGPSAGKSSALALLRTRLSARGFQVLTVPENATHFLANSDGFQPEWAGTHAQVCMQRVFLDYQIAQEDAFKDFAALHPRKPAVLLLDCCTINSKVYVSDEQWEEVLRFQGKPALDEEQLLSRYDLAIHMVTCALSGHYEWGPGSNNPGRYHSPDQAKVQDDRCLQVFSAHKQFRVVPHFDKFDDKIEKVAEFVNDALHVEGLAGKRRRKTCRLASADGEAGLRKFIGCESASGAVVTTSFLDGRLQHSVRRHAKVSSEAWLKQFELWTKNLSASVGEKRPSDETSADTVDNILKEASECLYERRTQFQDPATPDSSYLTRRVITEQDFETAMESRSSDIPGTSAIKMLLRFVTNGLYYELFFFLGSSDLVLDFSASEESLETPAWLDFTSSKELVRHDSRGNSSPGASPGAESNPQGQADGKVEGAKELSVDLFPERPAKRRFLRSHSTEEAAMWGC